jgi:ABC-2 type transport system ATP-binding protein
MTDSESEGGLRDLSVGSAAVEVRGARRSFGDRVALNGVDLSLRPAGIYGLLGPNGAGKTSLVRAISGRLALEAGTIRVAGRDPTASPEARRALGLVPQEIALYPELSARENLEIFGALMGLRRSQRRTAVEWLLGRIQLSDRAEDRVETLSGGMRRRLNIAAGVVHRPQVLLLDEPTVGVDPAARDAIHRLLLELKREGMAILLTTHDLEQAAELADVVGILIDGEIRAEGRHDELVRQVFGDGKELIVSLASEPGGQGRSRLEGQGLRSSRDGRVWTGRLAGGLDDLSGLGARLEQEGLAVAELRVREPGLRGVFFHHAGREIEA